MSDFLPGLQLAEIYYRFAVAPILKTNFPKLKYSAGLIGPGSEVLGFDDRESTDHHWGLRLQIFVDARDIARKKQISRVLSENLPALVVGFSTNFSPPDPNDNNVRLPKMKSHGPIDHMIEIKSIADVKFPKSEHDWLEMPTQKLLELTSGRIFHDGLKLRPRLRKFAKFPRKVWLQRMARQWDAIGQNEAFVGRTGFRGDEIGSKLIAAQQVRLLMELCFLIDQKYAPYAKWFGTAFARLRCAKKLSPIFDRILKSKTWREREKNFSRAYEIVASMHNDLRITTRMPARVTRFHNRPYRVIHAEEFAKAIREKI